jgi:hypothetical protein
LPLGFEQMLLGEQMSLEGTLTWLQPHNIIAIGFLDVVKRDLRG